MVSYPQKKTFKNKNKNKQTNKRQINNNKQNKSKSTKKQTLCIYTVLYFNSNPDFSFSIFVTNRIVARSDPTSIAIPV